MLAMLIGRAASFGADALLEAGVHLRDHLNTNIGSLLFYYAGKASEQHKRGPHSPMPNESRHFNQNNQNYCTLCNNAIAIGKCKMCNKFVCFNHQKNQCDSASLILAEAVPVDVLHVKSLLK
jgi:hypothetical protein